MSSSLVLLNSILLLKNFLPSRVKSLTKKSVAVSYDPKHEEILFDALGLSVSITSSMIEGHMVNLHTVITRLIHRHTHGMFDNMQNCWGLCPKIQFIGMS